MASTHRYILFFALAAACGGGTSSVPPPSTPSSDPEAADASESKSGAALSEAEPGEAAPAEPKAEDPSSCETPASCAELGAKLVDQGDQKNGRIALERSCTGAVKVIDGCARLALLLRDEPGSTPSVAAEAAQHGCSAMGSDASNRAIRGKACAIWGAALRDGTGVDKDADKAMAAFTEGCQIGERDACLGAKQLQDQKDAASGVPGANMRVGRITTDGVTVEDIACKSEGGGLGGLLGSLVIGKPFADRKPRLDACVKTKHKTRVRWTATGGRMTNVEVISGEHPANRCIVRALAGAPATVGGLCAASIEVGK